jgi:zearalenone synthase (highly reducing iterative type I polyketide synthase)
MAIESARQEADSDKEISGFCMRDIKIDAALVIEEDTEPEVILAIRPHLTSTLDSGSYWMEFTVSSCTDGKDLRQNCSGLLMVEYASATGSAMSLERDTEIAAIQDDFLAVKKRCSKFLDVDQFYAHLTALGLHYGPTFANITEIHTAENETRCVSNLTIPEIESTIPATHQNRPHIIHPSTLDAIFHLAFAAIHNEPDAFRGAMVPTQIDEIMVRADIAHTAGTVLHGYAHSAQHGLRDMLTNIEMLDRGSSKPMVRVKGFRCSDISGVSTQSDNGHGATGVVKPITCEVSWKPAIEILSLEELQAVVDGQPEDIAAKAPSLDQAVLTLLKEVLTNVPRGRVIKPFQSFYDWIQNHVSSSRLQSEPVGRGSDSAFRFIGENLPGILQGQVIASKMLWNDSTLLGRLLSEIAGFEEILRKLNEVS